MAQQDNVWQQVAAPQIWGATDGYREMGNLFGQANQSIQGGLDAFKEEQTKNTNNELLRRVSSLGDPDSIRQGLSDGSLLQGLHTSRLGSNIYGDINNLGSSYLNQQNTKANTLGTNQINEERGYNFNKQKDSDSYLSDPTNRANWFNALNNGDSSLLASNTPVNLVSNFYANAQQGQGVLGSLIRNRTDSINQDTLIKTTDETNATNAFTTAMYGLNQQGKISFLNQKANDPKATEAERSAAVKLLNSITDNSNTNATPETSNVNLDAAYNPSNLSTDQHASTIASGNTGFGDKLYGMSLPEVMAKQKEYITQNNSNPTMTKDENGNSVKTSSALGYLQLTRAALAEAIKHDPTLANRNWNGDTIRDIGSTLFNHAQSLNKGNDTSKGDAYLKMLWGVNVNKGDSAGDVKAFLNKVAKHESGFALYPEGNPNTPKTLGSDYGDQKTSYLADSNRYDAQMKSLEANNPASYGNRQEVFKDLLKINPKLDQNTFNQIYNAMDQKYGNGIDNTLKPTVYGNAIKQSMGTSTSKVAQLLPGTGSYGGGFGISFDGALDNIVSSINKQASGNNSGSLVSSYKNDRTSLGQLNDQVDTAAKNISTIQNNAVMPLEQKRIEMNKAILVYNTARANYKKFAAEMNGKYGGKIKDGTNFNKGKSGDKTEPSAEVNNLPSILQQYMPKQVDSSHALLFKNLVI